MESSRDPVRARRTDALPPASEGSASALDRLFEACYDELRQLAHKCLYDERPDHSLQAADLVHEAYIRLVDTPKLYCRDRAHFFAVAARVMRHILVDYARRRRCARRMGLQRRVPLEEALTVSTVVNELDLVWVDLALTRLQHEAPLAAQIIEMRFFGGMTQEEIATLLHLALRTVRRHDAHAQARLHELMQAPARRPSEKQA